jgi:hypothetical protein
MFIESIDTNFMPRFYPTSGNRALDFVEFKMRTLPERVGPFGYFTNLEHLFWGYAQPA